MTATMIDAQQVLRALVESGVTRTQIARAVGCDAQTVLCWLFGMPMNATRRERWVLNLIEFAVEQTMSDRRANEPFEETTGPSAAAAAGAFNMLMQVLMAGERES